MKEFLKASLILILGLAVGYFLISFIFSAVILALKLVIGLLVLGVVAFFIWRITSRTKKNETNSI